MMSVSYCFALPRRPWLFLLLVLTAVFPFSCDDEAIPAGFATVLGDGETTSEIMRQDLIRLENGDYVTAFNALTPFEPTDNNNTVDDIGIHLGKIDADGAVIWDRYFPTDNVSRAGGVIQTRDGGFLIVGSQSNNAVTYDGTSSLLIKTDVEGNSLWEKTYDLGPLSIGLEVIENSDATLMLLARAGGPVLLELDADGNFLRQTNQSGIVNLLALDDDSQLLFGNHVKLYDDGQEVWIYELAESDNPATYTVEEVIVTPEGDYVGYGTRRSNPTVPDEDEVDPFAIKLTADGQLLWRKHFPETGDNVGTDLALTPAGNYLMLGAQYNADNTTTLRLRTLDPGGDQLSTQLVDFNIGVRSTPSDLISLDDRYAVLLGAAQTSSGVVRQVVTRVEVE